MPQCVAVLNDDLEFARMVSSLIADDGYETLYGLRGEAGFELVRREQPDVVILNVHHAGPKDWPLLRRLPRDKATASIPIIVCAADRTVLDSAASYIDLQQAIVLERFDLNEILAAVEQVVGPPDGK